jgi:transcriptional regulator with XRE-family HTH domain
LLSPEEIAAALERLNMTQKEAAERLGIAEATLSRWLTNTQIQTRAMDNLLRVYFAIPEVRQALGGLEQDRQLGIGRDPQDGPGPGILPLTKEVAGIVGD